MFEIEGRQRPVDDAILAHDLLRHFTVESDHLIRAEHERLKSLFRFEGVMLILSESCTEPPIVELEHCVKLLSILILGRDLQCERHGEVENLVDHDRDKSW